MEVYISQDGPVNIVELIGEIDGQTAPEAQDQILPLVTPGVQVLLDMTQLVYMSSAGLRMMLLLHRKFTEQGGKIVLIGVNQEIYDAMSATGFLSFFVLSDSYEAGLDALQN